MSPTSRPCAARRRPPAVLIACTTRDTDTVATAVRIADELRRGGVVADIAPVDRIAGLDRYRAVVLGGTLRAGHWPWVSRRFLDRHAVALSELPVWIFEFTMGVPGPRLTDALGGPIALVRTADRASVRGPLARFGAEAPRIGPGGTPTADTRRLRSWAQRIAGEVTGTTADAPADVRPCPPVSPEGPAGTTYP